jgi:lipid A disaccharide synthetase
MLNQSPFQIVGLADILDDFAGDCTVKAELINEILDDRSITLVVTDTVAFPAG